ncbi:MAG TPA: heparan N-sulfatase [Planctomycetaceae bacterium]|nr:heparan N-sulfatase [Planctomycetaceae bacterium]
MSGRPIASVAGVFVAVLWTILLQASGAEPTRNIVLYVTDDQGMDDASCYGHPVIKTPGLDALAHDGTRFTRAFCTTSSCSASRSVILTGMYNHATGQYGLQHSYHHFSVRPKVKSLPVLLEQAGYRTARFGKFHVAPEGLFRFGQFVTANQVTPRSPIGMAEHAKSFITADDQRPFFLYFCTHEPHRSFAREGFDRHSANDVVVPPYLPDTPECREELAQYYGSVERADSGLVRLIAILKETGHWDDTLIIFLSDNGIAFPGAKTTVYEPGIRLPCVIRDPDAKRKHVVSDAMITWADIMPTILDWAGAMPESPWFHGRSVLPILEEEHPKGWDEVYASHTFHEVTMYYPMRVIRTDRYKYILNLAHPLPYPFASDLYGSSTWQGVLRRGDRMYGRRTVEAYLHRPQHELYDLNEDPHETRNLADDPSHAEILADLQGRLRRWRTETADPWIVKYAHE